MGGRRDGRASARAARSSSARAASARGADSSDSDSEWELEDPRGAGPRAGDDGVERRERRGVTWDVESARSPRRAGPSARTASWFASRGERAELVPILKRGTSRRVRAPGERRSDDPSSSGDAGASAGWKIRARTALAATALVGVLCVSAVGLVAAGVNNRHAIAAYLAGPGAGSSASTMTSSLREERRTTMIPAGGSGASRATPAPERTRARLRGRSTPTVGGRGTHPRRVPTTRGPDPAREPSEADVIAAVASRAGLELELASLGGAETDGERGADFDFESAPRAEEGRERESGPPTAVDPGTPRRHALPELPASLAASLAASLPAASAEASEGFDERLLPHFGRYLVGLTTSAGFGDQFKRVSTYAAMARDLNRTLVLMPVFTSPHYALSDEESGDGGPGALHFEDYVRIAGERSTDAPGRVVAFRDAPARVRRFARRYPNRCLTSNDRPNPVQFLASANLDEAVVAPPGEFSTYEELVRKMRAPEMRDAETLCLASTFSESDYNKASHNEDARAWKSLDFRPKGRFENYWAHAVNAMARAAREKAREKDEGGRPREKDAAEAAGAGTPSSNPPPKRLGAFEPLPPKFAPTSAYSALHWRRGDKCGTPSKRQRSRRAGKHAFDANKTGVKEALLCDRAGYEHAAVLDLCDAMPPMYVATDDDDPAFVETLRRRGCFLFEDLRLGVPKEKLTDVDKLVIDVMLVAGAEASFTFGHTALARLYDRMRMSRGRARSINVSVDSAAFEAAYAQAMAGAGSGAAAEAALGKAGDELLQAEDAEGPTDRAGGEGASGRRSEKKSTR